MEIVKLRNITKSYRNVKVLDNINLTLEKGQIYGLVGLNGAGKTTLMNILAGLILPDEGELKLFEVSSLKSNKKELTIARKKIGFLIEEPVFYPNLDVRENLQTVQMIKGKTDKEEVEQIVQLIGLGGINERRKKLMAYSLGMRQRYGIGAALIGKPEVLVLDEPTNGLDIEGLREVREILKHLCDKGVTMLISSHNLNDLYKIAETFFFMRKGKVIEQWNHEQIAKRLEIENDIEALVRPIISENF